MMTGKEKCKILKEIRRQIAEKNDIRLVIEECTHKGKCRGSCPRCEAEVRLLERELDKRRAAGLKVTLAGISAGVLLTACTPVETFRNWFNGKEEVEGDMLPESSAETRWEPTMGELPPEIEGEVAVPEETEIDGTMPIVVETDEEEPLIAGMMIAPGQEETEMALEGDIAWPAEEDLP